MTLVCLSMPPSPSGSGSFAQLEARLLTVAPRIALAPVGGLAWADGRGFDARRLAQALMEEMKALALEPIRAGVAETPVAARVAATRPAPSQTITVVSPGEDRKFLAAYSIAVLEPPPQLAPLLAGLGLTRCGDLAALEREAVEVRLGRDGLALWRLARADDPHPLFGRQPRALPVASLEWTDYVVAGQERLLFIINALLGSVCDTLLERGDRARGLSLLFALANGTVSAHAVHSRRPTADRTTWLRQLRTELERIRLADAVCGVTLRVDAVSPPADRQVDLFDLGGGTARAVEEALARIVDDEGDALVTLDASAHPVPERRARWVPVTDLEAAATPIPLGTRAAIPAPAVALQLFPEPREIVVRTRPRRGFDVPVAYSASDGTYPLRETLGPDCISGGHWDAPYAREYYQGIRADGQLVLLARDVLTGGWALHGWWA